MPTYDIYFSDTLNCSIQIGDTAWVSTIDINGITTDTKELGVITGINGDIITVDVVAGVTPVSGDYFSFQKSAIVNESGLKGYYANVTFENLSSEYVELFAISSEAVISSK
jgi:hypothetical protein